MEGTMIWFQPAKRHGFIQTHAEARLRVDETGFASKTTLGDRCGGARVRFERLSGAPGETRAVREKRAKKHARAAGHRRPAEPAGERDAGTAGAK